MNDMSLTLHLTAPQSEKKAARELRREGVKAYVPRYQVKKPTHRHKKATTAHTKILAPGYVVAKGQSRYRQYVRSKIGTVTPAEMFRLLKQGRSQTSSGRATEQKKLWQVGDTVKVKVGPYADLTGKIIQDRGRAVIIEHESGRTIAVSVYHLTRPDP